MNKQTSLSHYNNMNIFSMHGLIGAYSKDGQEWADELKAVLTENMEWAYDFITKNWDGVELAKPEGTYMLYLVVINGVKHIIRQWMSCCRQVLKSVLSGRTAEHFSTRTASG